MDALTVTTLILVALTGHDSFRVREAASAALPRYAATPQGMGAILAGEATGCPETVARCKPLANRWYAAHAAAITEALTPPLGWPWIDGDATGLCGETQSYYLGLARNAGYDYCAPEWPAWREATRLLVRDWVAARRPVASLLRELEERHAAWCRSNGYPVPGGQ